MKKITIIFSMFLIVSLNFIACSASSQNNENSNKQNLEAQQIEAMEGNQEKYDFKYIDKLENTQLNNKNLFLLGSSVAYGHCSMQQSIGEYLTNRFSMNVTKETVSGTTLVDNGEDSYVSRMKKDEYKNKKFDLFICQLSTNDATKKLPLGDIAKTTDLNSFDTTTVTGAMEYIICYAKQIWNCPVYFFTGSHYDSAEYEAMYQRLIELSNKWNIKVLDLWSKSDFNNISSDSRKLFMHDDIHPTKAGYRDWWCPELEKQLLSLYK